MSPFCWAADGWGMISGGLRHCEDTLEPLQPHRWASCYMTSDTGRVPFSPPGQAVVCQFRAKYDHQPWWSSHVQVVNVCETTWGVNPGGATSPGPMVMGRAPEKGPHRGCNAYSILFQRGPNGILAPGPPRESFTPVETTQELLFHITAAVSHHKLDVWFLWNLNNSLCLCVPLLINSHTVKKCFLPVPVCVWIQLFRLHDLVETSSEYSQQ